MDGEPTGGRHRPIRQRHGMAPFRIVACASPAYLQLNGVPDTPEALAQHACIAYASATGRSARAWHFVRGEESFKVEFAHRLRVNDAKAMLVAALNGIGIAFISEDLARDDLQAGRLVRVITDDDSVSRPMRLLYHPDRRQTRKLKSFITAVVAAMGTGHYKA